MPNKRSLPRGTFTPYSQGVKANVIFFQKGLPTVDVWIFGARSNVPSITKKDRPFRPTVIRRRFRQGWQSFETLYRPLVNRWDLYDNSGATPRLIDMADKM